MDEGENRCSRRSRTAVRPRRGATDTHRQRFETWPKQRHHRAVGGTGNSRAFCGIACKPVMSNAIDPIRNFDWTQAHTAPTLILWQRQRYYRRRVRKLIFFIELATL